MSSDSAKSGASVLQTIRDRRQEILWWEFCCLLHDIGKLSSDFLRYRQTWHAQPGGYARKDPHDHNWLERDTILQKEFPELLSFFKRNIVSSPLGTISVERAVHCHINPNDGLLAILNAGDSIDARYDRNNPLAGCEQTDHSRPLASLECVPPPIFRGNVFGREQLVEPDRLDQRRREFYRGLSDLLGPYINHDSLLWKTTGDQKASGLSYEIFYEVRRLMKRSWDEAMSDTTRPDNDTSLWEHVYSVSTISKAFHGQACSRTQPLDAKGQKFRLWGIGFDSLRILSSSQKIGDVMGRRMILEDIFDSCIRELEYDTPVGNHIYRDQDCVFFLIPDFDAEVNQQIGKELEETAIGFSIELSGGEFVPHCVQSGPTRTLTVLPGLIEKLRIGCAVPVEVDPSKFIQKLGESIDRMGESTGICPVCRLRLIAKSKTGIESKDVCNTCAKRRSDAARERNATQSIFVSEIEDRNRRVALIQVRIGLRDWLNGKLVRTTFVTEPVGVKKTLRAIKQYVDLAWGDDPKLEQWVTGKLAGPITFGSMLSEFQDIARIECDCKRAADEQFPHLVYGRGLVQVGKGADALRVMPGLLDLAGWVKDLHGQPGFSDPVTSAELFNAISAKTPTPSTLLDVWETTAEFIESIAGSPLENRDENGIPWLADLLPKRSRYQILLEGVSESFNVGQAIDAYFGDSAVELVFRKKGNDGSARFDVLSMSQSLRKAMGPGASIKIGPSEYTISNGPMEMPNAYYPWRVISASPNELLVLVPANLALEITNEIYRRFLKRFAKVYGRLPIAITNVFFPDYLPIFSVLDAARRTERTMRAVQEGPWVETQFEMPCLVKQYGLHLGNGEVDSFHPYVIVDQEEDMTESAATIMGTIIPIADAVGKKVLVRPNVYLSYWVGSSSSRLDVETKAGLAAIPDNDGEHHNLNRVEMPDYLRSTTAVRGNASAALSLDKLDAELLGPWKALGDAQVSDAAFKNIVVLYGLKQAAWSGREVSKELARLIRVAAHRLPPEVRGGITQLVKDGRFDLFVKLHLQVLKQRLGKENEG